MTKIFWTPDEQEALYAEMVRQFVANPLLRKEQVLEISQLVLPKDRRRKMHNSAVYRWREMIDKARAAARAEPKLEPTPAPAVEPAQPKPQPDLLRAILDPLIEALADRIVERMELRAADFGGGVQHAYALRIKHDPAPPPNERVARTGVLVVGLLNQQAQTIINLFPHLEITCLTTEEALKREPLRRSHTLLMTKFINHSVQDKYRKAPNLLLCNGGVSELSAMLKNIS